MSFFITNAMAAAAPAHANQADGAFPLVMLVAIFVLFYFMIIRPNSKRAKEHKELISNLKKGDEIVTSGGILAKVANIDEQFIRISIAEGVDINVQRNAVVAVLPKGTIKAL
ncbi:SecYEG protein translocase auxillary subunit [Legionella busanensis]|uniref:Sec translocon accessory complex subunit YajC n=1 Tax=Legionella busanensis TaxID=190655 RepID=A0A378JL14_9GAMM|nr:preprotein translocase subunit YajC [Legionella busanensis]STX51884.1 SecYEG protein translocase auxillary subunit [Legionella busanensis]